MASSVDGNVVRDPASAGEGRACVVVLEVDQKQRYLFETDKLREMLGASRIIAGTVQQATEAFTGRGEIHNPVSGEIHAWAPLAERDSLLSGLWKLREVLDEAGVAHTCCYFETDLRHFTTAVGGNLRSVFHEASRRIRGQRDHGGGEDARPSCSLFAGCQIHALEPANHCDDKGGTGEPRRGLVGYRARAKLDRWETDKPQIMRSKLMEPVRKSLRGFQAGRALTFGNLTAGADWSTDLTDELDGKVDAEGTDSYVAFVCADGDGMGALLRNIDWNSSGWGDGRKPWQRSRDFAIEYDGCVEKAFIAAVVEVSQPRAERGQSIEALLHAIDTGKRKVRIPLLPQLLGGDDLWTVVDRRYAIPFARVFSTEFTKAAENEGVLKRARDLFAPKHPLTMSLGIAFAKAGYPAHAMADAAHELLSSAKKLRKGLLPLRAADSEMPGEGAVDWHWIQSTRSESLDDARGLLVYQDAGRTLMLTSRPWTITQAGEFQAASAILDSRVGRGKAEQLESILRLGHGLSTLAWKGWWDGLGSKERAALREINALLGPSWRLEVDVASGRIKSPWRTLDPTKDRETYASPLLDLLALGDTGSVGLAGDKPGGADAEG